MAQPNSDTSKHVVGDRVIYNPFDTIPFVHVGTIRAVKETKFGVQVQVEPDHRADMSLLTRWRPLAGVTKVLAIPRAA